MRKEKVLEVKDLSVSFRTPNGLVRAVREVSFDLYKGETLAIVGGSGSGKSVTNRAIMGILAGNAIIDSGEINYDNQDLTKLSEANFHKIRGNKIGMIFQDPLSSLNPTMKIGKQITEAMLVNGNRIKNRELAIYHHEYHNYLNVLEQIKILKREIIDFSYEVSVDEDLTKDEKKVKIKELKADHNARIKELQSKTSELKKIYLEKRKEAKEIVKKEVDEINVEKKNALDEISKQISTLKKSLSSNAANKDQIKKDIEAKEELLEEKREEYRRKFKVTKREAFETATEIMEEVGITESKKRFNQYPFQFSGGMRQRIVIATALTANPELLICDEPTTALDVTIQGQILNLIKEIKKERNLSVIFITHDLGVVANIADRVAVMYAGKIVEYGTAEEIFYDPKHPYTWALLSSVPDLDTTERLLSIPGTPPDMLFPPKGDAFADRNQYALEIDLHEKPPYFKVSDSHYAATWLLHPDAPKVEMPKIIRDRVAKYKKQDKAEQVSK
jgi:oligopeptide transport system ATP-binding protein